MVLAEFDYPLLNIFVTMFYIFLFVIWFWLLISIFGDLFRDHELSGWWKAFWVVFVIALPFLGILLYLILRGRGMSERAVAAQQAAQAEFDDYVRKTAGGSNVDELAKLSDLHDQGKLDDAEFADAKRRLLS